MRKIFGLVILSLIFCAVSTSDAEAVRGGGISATTECYDRSTTGRETCVVVRNDDSQSRFLLVQFLELKVGLVEWRSSSIRLERGGSTTSAHGGVTVVFGRHGTFTIHW